MTLANSIRTISNVDFIRIISKVLCRCEFIITISNVVDCIVQQKLLILELYLMLTLLEVYLMSY